MKKTYNINIGGYVYTIDDDAYDLLNNYIDTLQNAFSSNPDGKEIVGDIETRISELFQEKILSGKMVITLSDTEEVINRIGNPEDIISVSTDITESIDTISDNVTTNETLIIDEKEDVNPHDNIRIEKKLYRDPKNGILGGVCAGLAEYLNVDVSIIRILFIISIFISLSITAFVYIVLWILLPEVRTPYDRMKLKGEKTTIKNIGENVTKTFQRESEQTDLPGSSSKSSFLSGLMKVIIIIFFIIAFPVLFALGIALVGSILALLSFIVAMIGGSGTLFLSHFMGYDDYNVVIFGLLTSIGYILVIGVPILALVRALTSKNKEKLSNGWKWALVISWIIGFILAGTFTGLLICYS